MPELTYEQQVVQLHLKLDKTRQSRSSAYTETSRLRAKYNDLQSEYNALHARLLQLQKLDDKVVKLRSEGAESLSTEQEFYDLLHESV